MLKFLILQFLLCFEEAFLDQWIHSGRYTKKFNLKFLNNKGLQKSVEVIDNKKNRISSSQAEMTLKNFSDKFLSIKNFCKISLCTDINY